VFISLIVAKALGDLVSDVRVVGVSTGADEEIAEGIRGRD